MLMFFLDKAWYTDEIAVHAVFKPPADDLAIGGCPY